MSRSSFDIGHLLASATDRTNAGLSFLTVTSPLELRKNGAEGVCNPAYTFNFVGLKEHIVASSLAVGKATY
jgi:hypothetical protein